MAWLCACARVRMVFVGRDVLGWEPSTPNHKTSPSINCVHEPSHAPQTRCKKGRRRQMFPASLMLSIWCRLLGLGNLGPSGRCQGTTGEEAPCMGRGCQDCEDWLDAGP